MSALRCSDGRWNAAHFPGLRKESFSSSTFASMLEPSVERSNPYAVAGNTERTPSLGELCEATPSRKPAFLRQFQPLWSLQTRIACAGLAPCGAQKTVGTALSLLTCRRKTPNV